jgi:hypothetical protein
MNAVVNSSVPVSNSGGAGAIKTIIGAAVFVGVAVGLYYLYKFLYGDAPSSSAVDLLSGVVPTNKTATEPTSNKQVVSTSNLTGVLDGGQYSTSFWIYVADTKGGGVSTVTPKLLHLLEISENRFGTGTKGKTLLFIGLNPNNGSLVVRQNTSDPSYQIDNSLSGASSSTKYNLDNLITNYSTGSFSSDDRCDILNGIEYQRWILVSVVANGRTLDVYIDGKLARSCVYKGGFALGSTTGKGTAYFGLDNNDALKGFFGSSKFYNYALTPDAIWSLYQAGPTGSFDIKSWFSNLFNVNVAIGKTQDLNKP